MELSGNLLDYFIVFWSGVLVSFTPCLYPVMPITAALIGGFNAESSKRKGFVLSVLYVFGFAITYCTLGVVAVLTGKIFGQILNSPYVFIFVANVLISFALILFDVIPLPAIGISVSHKIEKRGFVSVILFGMAAALIVGPCSAPILITLLAYVGSKQNLFHAVSLLFVFSYGVGASLIIVGTFSGLVTSLPKSGKWLHWVKIFLGILLILFAEYLLLKAGRLML
jgi:thiol:disulfide interchange protein